MQLNNYELTVQHVHDGVVNLYPTDHVRIQDGVVSFSLRPDGMCWREIEGGKVYVLNSVGKTIHTHHFDGPRAA
jgi:hypothetical protein